MIQGELNIGKTQEIVLFSIFVAIKTIYAYSLMWDNFFGLAGQAIKLSNLGAPCIYSFKLSGTTNGVGSL